MPQTLLKDLQELGEVTNSETKVHIGAGIPSAVEMVIAFMGLLLSAPVIVLSAFAIAATSRGEIFFKQKRMGKDGEVFTFYKLRTMTASKNGPQVTAISDARVTGIGKILRKTKIDELPELWNVLKGDLALVGPRPEVPRYIDLRDPLWRAVLSVRPGLTDPVTLRLRNEEQLLGGVDDVEAFYLSTLLPYKLKGYLNYLQERDWRRDVKVLCQTAVAILLPGKTPPPTLAEICGLAGEDASRTSLERGSH